MTHLKQECGCIQQLLNLPVTFFQQIEELDDIEELLSQFVGASGLQAIITDYSYGGVNGDGNSIKVVFCCRHGNSTGLGITMEKRDSIWQVAGEWNDTCRFCPSCEGYDTAHTPPLQAANSTKPGDVRSFTRNFEPSPCIKTESI